MEDPRDRLLRYLNDAYAAELGIAEVLQGFVNETKNETAHAAFEEHLLVTKDQALRLEKRLRSLGGQPSGSKGFFNSLMGKLSDFMHAAHDDYDKTTQDLIKAYGIEHLEIGMYAALAAYARAYGDQDTAALAEQLMAEEKEAADRVRPMIATSATETFTASMQKVA